MIAERFPNLPTEIHAQVFVEPPVVRLEDTLQPSPGGRVHRLIRPFLAPLYDYTSTRQKRR
jgi:hypothetical protein